MAVSHFYPEKKASVRAALLLCSMKRIEIAALTGLSPNAVSRMLTSEKCFLRVPAAPGSGEACLWRYDDRLDQHRKLPLRHNFRYKPDALRKIQDVPPRKREIKEDGVRLAKTGQKTPQSIKPKRHAKPPAAVADKPLTSSLGTGLKNEKTACIRRLLASNYIGERDKDVLHHILKDYQEAV